MKRGNRILIDTNAILEAHRVGCWKALCGFFSMETVEWCIIECGEGEQFRENRIPVEIDVLKRQVRIHSVSPLMIAELAVRSRGAFDSIHDGEKHLLAYAMAQSNAYLLCSPDKDCMRVGMILDILRRFVSLEKIAENAGCRRLALRGQYTEKWHQSFCGILKLDQL